MPIAIYLNMFEMRVDIIEGIIRQKGFDVKYAHNKHGSPNPKASFNVKQLKMFKRSKKQRLILNFYSRNWEWKNKKKSWLARTSFYGELKLWLCRSTALKGQTGMHSIHPQHRLISINGASPRSKRRKALPRQTSPAKHLLHAGQRSSSILNINVCALPCPIKIN